MRDFSAIAHEMILGRIARTTLGPLTAQFRALREASARKDRLCGQAERMVEMGSWRMDIATQAIEWSPGVYAIHALSSDNAPPVADALNFYCETDRAIVEAAMTDCTLNGVPFDLELDFIAADGKRKRVRAVGELERIDGRPAALIGMFQDISARFRTEAVLRDQALTDPLTGLANRAALQQHLAELFAASPAPNSIAALLIDLDGFKAVNDQLGHSRGDEILIDICARIRAEITDGSLLARYGGDEFVVITTGEHATIRAMAHVRSISEAVRFTLDGATGPIEIGASVGCAASIRGDKPTDLLRRADDAMYRRKCAGGSPRRNAAGRAAL